MEEEDLVYFVAEPDPVQLPEYHLRLPFGDTFQGSLVPVFALLDFLSLLGTTFADETFSHRATFSTTKNIPIDQFNIQQILVAIGVLVFGF